MECKESDTWKLIVLGVQYDEKEMILPVGCMFFD